MTTTIHDPIPAGAVALTDRRGLAKALGVSIQTSEKWVRAQGIPRLWVGGKVRYDLAVVRERLNSLFAPVATTITNPPA